MTSQCEGPSRDGPCVRTRQTLPSIEQRDPPLSRARLGADARVLTAQQSAKAQSSPIVWPSHTESYAGREPLQGVCQPRDWCPQSGHPR